MECDDGSPTETDYEAANVLNTFFTSVFTKESLFDIPSLFCRTGAGIHHKRKDHDLL